MNKMEDLKYKIVHYSNSNYVKLSKSGLDSVFFLQKSPLTEIYL